MVFSHVSFDNSVTHSFAMFNQGKKKPKKQKTKNNQKKKKKLSSSKGKARDTAHN